MPGVAFFFSASGVASSQGPSGREGKEQHTDFPGICSPGTMALAAG